MMKFLIKKNIIINLIVILYILHWLETKWKVFLLKLVKQILDTFYLKLKAIKELLKIMVVLMQVWLDLVIECFKFIIEIYFIMDIHFYY